ncbi:MAG TPA: VCBS repeat-containing protein, partial [Bryobacteraceae bacterium]|nr:VCBS repeat-containing protein [Bryobacteraceae bacterium]
MIGGGSKWWTRRSFLERSTLAGAWLAARPRLIDGKPVSNVVSPVCRLQAQAALSPNLQKFVTLLTPGQDQFVCEKYAAELEVLLGEFSSVLCKSVTDVLTLAALTADEVAFTSFSNPSIAPLRRGGPIRTERITFSAEERHGKAAFLQSWKDYWRSLRKLETAELQIVGLQVLSETPLFIETHVRYDFAGDRGSDIREERTGEWILEWRRDPGRWKVQRWQVSEEIRASLTGPGFADVTRECLGSNASYTRQVLPGVDYWRTTLDAACGIDVYGNNGVAVGDIYGDGFDGFYVCQPAGLPNILYRNRGDGTFEDITQATGLGLLDGTASALFADFTNSGTQDLLV